MIIKFFLRIIYTIVVLIEALVAIRFVLLLINANVENAIVAFVMKYSEIFVAPFYGITQQTITLGPIEIDLVSLIALGFYTFLGFIILEMMKAFSRE